MTTAEIIADFELKLAACNTDEERCKVYAVSTYLLAETDVLLAQTYSEQFIQLAQKCDSTKYLALSNLRMGFVLISLGKPHEALVACNRSLGFYADLREPKSISFALGMTGWAYGQSYLIDEAVESYQKAIEISLAEGDVKVVNSLQHDFAATYSKFGMYDKARDMLLALLKEGNNGAGLYLNLALEYIRLRDLEKAEEYLNFAATACEREVRIGFNTNLNHLYASLFIKKKFYSRAHYYLEKAKELYKQNGNPVSRAENLSFYGEYYIAKKEWQKAEESYLELLEIISERNIKPEIAEALNNLKEIAEHKQDYKKAFEYANRTLALEKEIKEEQIKTMQKMLDVKQRFAVVQKEKEVTEEKNRVIEIEKQKSEALLLNILPAEVAEELKAKGSADAKLFDEVTVIYTDFVSFTKVSQRLSPQQLVDELNVCFKAFDEIIGRYNIEKIKTMGDGFIAAAGLPVANTNHAADMVSAALEIQQFITARIKARNTNAAGTTDGLGEIRVGIHSGPVVAGIVGVKKFAYDIWGDTVNTAARMEQNGEVGKVNISEATYQLVKDKFNCQYRGEIEAKNKGLLKMYFINNK